MKRILPWVIAIFVFTLLIVLIISSRNARKIEANRLRSIENLIDSLKWNRNELKKIQPVKDSLINIVDSLGVAYRRVDSIGASQKERVKILRELRKNRERLDSIAREGH